MRINACYNVCMIRKGDKRQMPITGKAVSKAVSKNCTIPSWMNELALEKGLNFSQVLQEALAEKIKM